MTGTIGLLPELRNRIYRFIFNGERLLYVDYLDVQPGSIERARCTSILLTSRQTYQESHPIFLDTIQIDATENMDFYYPTLASVVLKPIMVRHLYLSATTLSSALVFLWTEDRGLKPMEECIRAMTNLRSLTYFTDSGYGLDDKSVSRGGITPKGIEYIQKNPHRMIGRDEDGASEDEERVIRSIILAWYSAQKSFKLFAEAEVFDGDDPLPLNLPMVARLDLDSANVVVDSCYHSCREIAFAAEGVEHLIQQHFEEEDD